MTGLWWNSSACQDCDKTARLLAIAYWYTQFIFNCLPPTHHRPHFFDENHLNINFFSFLVKNGNGTDFWLKTVRDFRLVGEGGWEGVAPKKNNNKYALPLLPKQADCVPFVFFFFLLPAKVRAAPFALLCGCSLFFFSFFLLSVFSYFFQ